jgi:prohibitin 2
MSNNAQEMLKNLQRMASQAGRGGGGPSPKGLAGGIGSLLLLGGGALVLQNSLFNVDGGHRAIKYTRLGGVSKEIYSEGTEHNLDNTKSLGGD